jgi:hypothetical protein
LRSWRWRQRVPAICRYQHTRAEVTKEKTTISKKSETFQPRMIVWVGRKEFDSIQNRIPPCFQATQDRLLDVSRAVDRACLYYCTLCPPSKELTTNRHIVQTSSMYTHVFLFFLFIWRVRLLALRPLLAYCASLGW